MRQATISEIENGKRYINAVELLLLSDALEKPILYFVPEKYRKRIQKDLTDPELDELLLIAQKLNRQDLQRLIVQTRALVKNS